MFSWVNSIRNWFGRLFSGQANATNLVNVFHSAAAGIQLLAPGVILALQQAGQSEASNEVQSVANEVTTDLGVVSGLFAQAQAGNTTVTSRIIASLNSISTNLSGLLAAGHIKNTATVTEVTNVTNAFIAEVKVVIGMITPPPPANPQGQAAS